jgi:hypothetical protein
MVKSIFPASPEWVYTYIVQPAVEGAERLNRFWSGINSHSLDRTPLTLKNRIISLLTGFALMFFPMANSIMWIAWQTFGSPEDLSDPFVFDEDRFVVVAKEQMIKTPPKLVEEEEKKEEFYCTKFEYTDGRWTVESRPSEVFVKKENENSTHTARYIDEELHEYTYHNLDEESVFTVKRDDDRLHVELAKGKKKITKKHDLEGPWIQQLTIGLKQFVLSDDLELLFYMVRPDTCEITKVKAEKKGFDDGYLKVHIAPNSLFASALMSGDAYFEPNSGKMVRMIERMGLSSSTVDRLSPVLEHQ